MPCRPLQSVLIPPPTPNCNAKFAISTHVGKKSMKNQATTSQTPTLDLSQVRPADIIVTWSGGAASKAIRIGSCSSYSHAILALDGGKCIHALPGEGVKDEKLSDALEDSSAATLYRHHRINSSFAAWICDYAEEQVREQKTYDYVGALRSGVATGCFLTKYSLEGMFIQLVDGMGAILDGGHDDSFFCSELIARAYEKNQLPLINRPAHTVTPGALVKSKNLKLIQELITT